MPLSSFLFAQIPSCHILHLTITFSGANSKKITLSWVRRLKIAVDAAKGISFPIFDFLANDP